MSDATVSAICYDECNNVYVIAQKIGKTPALCAPGSEFNTAVTECNSCVQSHGDTQGSASPLIALPDIQEFIDFCEGQPVLSVTTGNSTASALFSAAESIGSIYSSLESQLSQILTSSVTSVTSSAVPVSISIMTVISTPSSTSSPSPPPSLSPSSSPNQSSSKAWIAGAVVGPIIFIFAISIFTFLRFRRKMKSQVQDVNVKEDDVKNLDKAQLHSDSKPAEKPAELDGSSAEPRAELPAMELVGSELEVPRGDE